MTGKCSVCNAPLTDGFYEVSAAQLSPDGLVRSNTVQCLCDECLHMTWGMHLRLAEQKRPIQLNIRYYQPVNRIEEKEND